MAATSLSGSRRPQPPCCTFILLVVLLLLVTVFAQPSSCRPLPLNNNNGGANNKASTNIILALPTEAVGVAAGGTPSSAREAELADKYGHHLWLLDRKPRGKAPPSAPSKRTNAINT